MTFGGDYDIIVAGGGPGGVPAAIAGARMGAKVLLIQNRPMLGGNSAEGGITLDGPALDTSMPVRAASQKRSAACATGNPNPAEIGPGLWKLWPQRRKI